VLCAIHQCPEFVDAKGAPVLANPLLVKEDGTRRIQLDGQGDQPEQWPKEHESKESHTQVQSPLGDQEQRGVKLGGM
jgi:hypothetical protein